MVKGILILISAIFVASAYSQISTNTPRENAGDVSTNSIHLSASYTLDDKHPLEPGDKLSFQVLEDKHPPVNLVVTDSGDLDVPYLGRVAVTGKTCRQVGAALKIRLEQDYYYRATVIVGLDSVNQLRGQAFISGEVHSQGMVDILFKQNLTVGEAIIRMGGFTDFANKQKIRVVRSANTGSNEKKIFIVNVEEVMEKGKTENDLVLEPGDYVIVPGKIIRF